MALLYLRIETTPATSVGLWIETFRIRRGKFETLLSIFLFFLVAWDHTIIIIIIISVHGY